MPHYFSSNFTLGILGGGQLGKMLLTETRKFDITTKVLDPSAMRLVALPAIPLYKVLSPTLIPSIVLAKR